MKALVALVAIATSFAFVSTPQEAQADCTPSCRYKMCDLGDSGIYRIEADPYHGTVEEFLGGTQLPGLELGDELEVYDYVEGQTSYLVYVVQGSGAMPFWVSSMFVLEDGRAHCEYQDASIAVADLVIASTGDSCVADVEAAGVESIGPCNDTCSFVSGRGGLTSVALILFGLIGMRRRRRLVSTPTLAR